MSYNINDIKQIVQTIANKQERGRIRPDDFNAACQFVNAQLVTEYLGLTEDYRPGQPVSAMGPDLNRRAKMLNYPIRGEQDIFFDTNGRAGFPEGCIYPLTATATLVLSSSPLRTRVINYDILEDGHAASRLSSSISGPTADHPILQITSTGLQRHPKSFGSNRARLIYNRYPRKPVWGFTVSSGRDVYSAEASTQFEWPDLSLPAIVGKVLKVMGINFRDADIVGVANQQIQTGK